MSAPPRLPLAEDRLRVIVQFHDTDAGRKIGISNFLCAVEVSEWGMTAQAANRGAVPEAQAEGGAFLAP